MRLTTYSRGSIPWKYLREVFAIDLYLSASVIFVGVIVDAYEASGTRGGKRVEFSGGYKWWFRGEGGVPTPKNDKSSKRVRRLVASLESWIKMGGSPSHSTVKSKNRLHPTPSFFRATISSSPPTSSLLSSWK